MDILAVKDLLVLFDGVRRDVDSEANAGAFPFKCLSPLQKNSATEFPALLLC
ncbi:hypothetical protein [Leptolyngbya sp. FACHB-321]|uniref:hypothetical protein n=1 Tax=Leptolyngbya sp. FACHB-321 TaxID=2692807 RepID=UPI00168A1353|nr:hypothetical protein [Leptolyngbya sp. FACHB-321]